MLIDASTKTMHFSEDTEPGAIATALNMVVINVGRVRSLSLPVLYSPNGDGEGFVATYKHPTPTG